jgi:hypothetical protein
MANETQAIYEHTDIPAGMTCAEYRRRRRVAEQRQNRLYRVLRRLRARG